MRIQITGIDEEEFEDLEKLFTEKYGLVKMDESGFGSWCGIVLVMSNESKDLLIKQELQKLQTYRNQVNRKIASLKKANLKIQI